MKTKQNGLNDMLQGCDCKAFEALRLIQRGQWSGLLSRLRTPTPPSKGQV
jgi:hypothetical protein